MGSHCDLYGKKLGLFATGFWSCNTRHLYDGALCSKCAQKTEILATEIFTRINVGGKPLSVFEIMVAKTYGSARNFDLSEKFDELIEQLHNVNYETVSSSMVLQAVSVCLVKECSKKNMDHPESQHKCTAT